MLFLILFWAAFVYIVFGLMYTTRLIVRYQMEFSPEERSMMADLDGDSWKTAIVSFFRSTLTWPWVMRYIARETRYSFLVERMETDRVLRMGV